MTEFEHFTEVVAELRSEHGCPWDKEQTHMSLKRYCIEEAAEVLAGINIFDKTGNPDNLCEELGDLLLQIVLHAQIAKEEGLFDIDDVIRGAADKMIRRHPHVFGTVSDNATPAVDGGNARPDNATPAAESGACTPGNTKKSVSETTAQNSRMPSIEEINSTWENIKKQEKAGHEWMDEYLPEAFTEGTQMLELARKRKEEKRKNSGKNQ